MPARRAIDRWKAANFAASAAERSVTLGYASYFRGEGTEPPAEMLAEAKRLRELANALLATALAATGATAAQKENGATG